MKCITFTCARDKELVLQQLRSVPEHWKVYWVVSNDKQDEEQFLDQPERVTLIQIDMNKQGNLNGWDYLTVAQDLYYKLTRDGSHILKLDSDMLLLKPSVYEFSDADMTGVRYGVSQYLQGAQYSLSPKGAFILRNCVFKRQTHQVVLPEDKIISMWLLFSGQKINRLDTNLGYWCHFDVEDMFLDDDAVTAHFGYHSYLRKKMQPAVAWMRQYMDNQMRGVYPDPPIIPRKVHYVLDENTPEKTLNYIAQLKEENKDWQFIVHLQDSLQELPEQLQRLQLENKDVPGFNKELLKYYFLYTEGGVYLAESAKLESTLSSFIPQKGYFYTVRDVEFRRVFDEHLIASSPQSKTSKMLLDNMQAYKDITTQFKDKPSSLGIYPTSLTDEKNAYYSYLLDNFVNEPIYMLTSYIHNKATSFVTKIEDNICQSAKKQDKLYKPSVLRTE